MVKESLLDTLNELKHLLLKEKEALIKNETQLLQELVAEKEALVSQLENAILKPEEKEQAQDLIAEVQRMQETNAMLTEQAMNYAGTFINAFQKEAQKSATYSKEGDLKNAKNSGIIDQSL